MVRFIKVLSRAHVNVSAFHNLLFEYMCVCVFVSVTWNSHILFEIRAPFYQFSDFFLPFMIKWWFVHFTANHYVIAKLYFSNLLVEKKTNRITRLQQITNHKSPTFISFIYCNENSKFPLTPSAVQSLTDFGIINDHYFFWFFVFFLRMVCRI